MKIFIILLLSIPLIGCAFSAVNHTKVSENVFEINAIGII